MDSDFQQQQYQHHFQGLQRQFHHQKPQTNSLTRFRSAPSSYFASFLDAVDNTVSNTTNFGGSTNSVSGSGSGSGTGERGDFANARPLSPETENIFANFMSSMGGEKNTTSSQKLCDIPENSPVQQPSQFMVGVKQEAETFAPQQQQQQQQQSNYSGSSQQMVYHSQSKPPLANQNHSVSSSFGAAPNSMGMDSLSSQMKIRSNNNNNSSGLTRHSSSPAGFFADILNLDNGFGLMKGMENYGGGGGGGGSGGGGGNSQMNFSSGQATPASGLMRQNSDVEAKVFSNSGNNNNNDSNYISTGFNNMSSWDDSILSDKFSSLDRGAGEDDRKIFSELNASENQSGDGRNRPPPLAHHLSLPNTSAELSALEKLLQFQDTVPCRIRAKRGCATHPRSIAERVRRTRISERMRKLQDLVPNMDKQTNTADMLDLAVEYIKELQNQVKNLNDNRAKCTCS